MSAPRAAGDAIIDTCTRQLVSIAEQLAAELHPGRNPRRVGADSELERELGFDSLARVELLRRVEQTFGVRLSETAFAGAVTLRDLAALVNDADRAQPAAWRSLRHETASESPALAAPEAAQTLLEVLSAHAALQPARTHIHLLGEHGDEQRISYADLLAGARTVAGALLTREPVQGRCIGIMLPTGTDYLFSFFGAMLAGAIPVPIYPPTRLTQIEDHLRRHARILANAEAVLLVAPRQAQPLTRLLGAQVQSLRAVLCPEQLRDAAPAPLAQLARGSDTAFLQYTSGSTGQPKGVVLSHAQILANIRAMGERAQVSARDCFVSWLPLYHDMGLIGAWLGSLYFAMPLVLMSPLQFLLRPRRWLWAIHRYHGTLSASPNFGYQLCLDKIADADLHGLDLGSWRLAFNGAEPVSAQTMRAFGARFAAFGLRPQALAPVYGLAESAVGVAFPPLQRGLVTDRVQRAVFSRRAHALPAVADDGAALEFVACGQPLPGYEMRVVDAGGRELPERREGRLEFRGPSATSGYFRNPEASRRLFDNGWLDTGDLAYIAGGDVYPTSRVKDIIIRGGRNIYPYEVEAAVGELPEVRKGCVAVFGSTDPRSGTERVVVLAETRLREREALEQLRARVHALCTDLLDMPPDDVVLTSPRAILKTSSGKIRRAACRELYERGQLETRRSVWWQFARLGAGALLPQWRRLRQSSAARLYAVYVYGLLALTLPPLWLLIMLTPGLARRWRLTRAALRGLFRLCGISLRVRGAEFAHGARGAVLIANHASYLDSPALAAALPLPASFVAKEELRRQPLIGALLRRLNTQFVERFDQSRSVEAAGRLAHSVREGKTLLVFPEGTLQRMPGLQPFHVGAFSAAAANRAAVLPIAITGTRSILRDGSWLPRRGAITVTLSQPIAPQGEDWRAALALRDGARTRLLDEIGEPDLEALGA